MIRKFIEAQESGSDEVVVWGDGSPTREFLYVADAAEGIVLAAEAFNGSEPVNLGSGTEISIRDLAGLHRAPDRFQRAHHLGHDQAQRAAPPRAGYCRARKIISASEPAPRSKKA